MSYRGLYLYLAILFFTISCSGQHNEPKKELSNNSKITKNSPQKQQELAPVKENRKDYVPGEILIKFKEGTDDQAIKAIQVEVQLKTIRLVIKPNLYLMKILDGSSVEYVMERLQNYKEVKYSEPNYLRSITNTKPKEKMP